MSELTTPAPRLSPWWRHATVLVMIFGFSVLATITALTYKNAPPIPERVTDGSGAVLFDERAILHGQEVFLKRGLMEHGTLWGHGAYLGPDYTAEYLHRLAETCNSRFARERSGSAAEPSAEDVEAAAPLTARLLKQNRYAPATRTLVFSPCETASFATQQREWDAYFRGSSAPPGLPASFISDPGELKDLSAYFAWATWATVANRP